MLSTKQHEQITEFAEHVRDVFEEMSACDKPAARFGNWITGHRFPVGWCELASTVFARLLARHFKITQLDICIGSNPNEAGTHHWVRISEEMYVDLTLDQFGDHLPPVVIYKDTGLHSTMFSNISIKPLLTMQLRQAYFERALFKIDVEITKRTSAWRTANCLANHLEI